MQLNVKSTTKASLIDLSDGRFKEHEFTLNSGLRLAVDHVIIDGVMANIHLLNGKVITNVHLDCIDFDRDENEIAIKIASGEISAPSSPKKRRCCGG